MTDDFSEIGCRKCGKGAGWKIFTDGKGNFRAEHECGHISNFEIKRKPDPVSYDRRLFV